MAGDRIEGEGVDGRLWEVVASQLVSSYAPSTAALLEVEGPTFIDAQDATRIADFLLAAAKVDLVGAARRVVEAQAQYEKTAGREYSWEEHEKAAAELDNYLVTLASELAKLDAMVGHDMSEATREK